jgi:hypothetical protein
MVLVIRTLGPIYTLSGGSNYTCRHKGRHLKIS